jgi:hypothetical protein
VVLSVPLFVCRITAFTQPGVAILCLEFTAEDLEIISLPFSLQAGQQIYER